jgi:hypothetical protein
MAAATASAYTKLAAWRTYGESFQLGYVVGYLDAVSLAKRSDMRALSIPSGGRANHARWRAMVNEFYADPANEKRSVPDAMAAAGKRVFEEMMKSRQGPGPTPMASPGAPATSDP